MLGTTVVRRRRLPQTSSHTGLHDLAHLLCLVLESSILRVWLRKQIERNVDHRAICCSILRSMTYQPRGEHILRGESINTNLETLGKYRNEGEPSENVRVSLLLGKAAPCCLCTVVLLTYFCGRTYPVGASTSSPSAFT